MTADESSPFVPTRCLPSLVSNGNLIFSFLYECKFNKSSQVIGYCSQNIKQKRSFHIWTVFRSLQ